jgi:hypothetical protein
MLDPAHGPFEVIWANAHCDDIPTLLLSDRRLVQWKLHWDCSNPERWLVLGFGMVSISTYSCFQDCPGLCS